MIDEDDLREDDEDDDDLPEWLKAELGPPVWTPLSGLPADVLALLPPEAIEQIEAKSRQSFELHRQRWEREEAKRRQEVADSRMLRRYAPEVEWMVNNLQYSEGEPDWESIEAACPVPAMPYRVWESICSLVRRTWKARQPSSADIAELTAELLEADGLQLDLTKVEEIAQEVRCQLEADHRLTCADLLRQQTVSFIVRFLLPPDPIPTDQAEALPPRQWQAVALLCNRRLTLAEAAEVMGVEPGTVKRHFELAAEALGLTSRELRRRRLGA